MSERFYVSRMVNDDPVIWDDEFGWDACIRVGGDFYGPDKEWFLQAIAVALNKSPLPTREQWEHENPELAAQIMHGGDDK